MFLINPYWAADAGPPEAIFLGTSELAGNIEDHYHTITYNSPPSPSRMVVAILMCERFNNRSLGFVTLDGQPMYIAAQLDMTASWHVYIAYANVPTGTSGTIRANWPNSVYASIITPYCFDVGSVAPLDKEAVIVSGSAPSISLASAARPALCFYAGTGDTNTSAVTDPVGPHDLERFVQDRRFTAGSVGLPAGTKTLTGPNSGYRGLMGVTFEKKTYAPPAAAPYLVGTPVGSAGGYTTSFPVTIAPHEVGDLLVVVGESAVGINPSLSNGWQYAANINWGGGGADGTFFAYRIATGSDDLTVNYGPQTYFNASCFVVRGYDPGNPIAAAAAYGSNPPGCTLPGRKPSNALVLTTASGPHPSAPGASPSGYNDIGVVALGRTRMASAQVNNVVSVDPPGFSSGEASLTVVIAAP